MIHASEESMWEEDRATVDVVIGIWPASYCHDIHWITSTNATAVA